MCGWRKCLVAWIDFGAPRSVRGVIVESDDMGLGTREIVISSAPSLSASGISAAWGHDRFLVVWSDTRLGNPDIFATLVKPHGALPDPDGFPIATGPETEIQPALAYNGSRVLATWSRLTPERFSVRGNFVRADSPLASPDGFVLSGASPMGRTSSSTVPHPSSRSPPSRSSSAPA